MGELVAQPPVVHPETGVFHVYKLAEAQRRDPIISWFVNEVVKPIEQGKHARTKETPDMHPEAKSMLRQRGKYSMSSGSRYGNNELLVFREQQVVVPPGYRQDLMQSAHTVAHVGAAATQQTLEKYFFWPNMAKDIDTLLSTCVGCLHKYTSNLKKGEHFSKEIPPGKCHLVYVDLVGPVAIKSKKKYLLTIMDAFSRYADAIPLEGKTSREVAEALTVSLTGVYGVRPFADCSGQGDGVRGAHHQEHHEHAGTQPLIHPRRPAPEQHGGTFPPNTDVHDPSKWESGLQF